MDFPKLFEFIALRDFWDYLVIAFLLALLVQLFFYLIVFLRLAFYKDRYDENKEQSPVSVIICARNERENLLEFLPLYLKQDYPTFEVIVVNDNSTDDTTDVLKAFALQHDNLKIVNVPDTDRFFGSKKFALTLGIKAAKYKSILLTDADCKPTSDQWIRLMSNYSGRKKIVLGFGAYEKRKGLLNRLIRFETFYTGVQYLSFSLAKSSYMGVGRNLAYQSELFFKNKGFARHQHILSGDDDLFINEVANKYNTQIVVDKAAHTISKPKTTYREWIRQKKRHFLSGTHYKFRHKFMLGMLQFSQLLFIALFVVLIVQIRPVYLIVVAFLVRYLIQLLTFRLSANKLGGKDLLLLFPIYELFFMLFNPLLVISNTIKKNTKWS